MAKSGAKTAARKAALQGKPIYKNGMFFWAITMGGYEEWAQYKSVWMARQSKFPVSCIMLPFLEALFQLDMDAIDKTGKPAGLLYNVMYVLGMALRLGNNCVQAGNIYLKADEEQRKFLAIGVKLPTGEEKEITSEVFSDIRKTVLWMNGEELPDESENDELLETEQFLNERNAPKLTYDLLDLEASVALAYGCRVKDVLDWSVLEFETCRRAIQRDKKHLICGIGETNGCKWEGGNPYPSWCFDREQNSSGALIAKDRFGKTKTNKKE